MPALTINPSQNVHGGLSMTERCARCKAEVDGARLCDRCCDLYEQACIDLIVLVPHLEVAVVGMANVARATVHGLDRSLELAQAEAVEARAVPAHLRSRHGQIALPATALPVNLEASELLAESRRILRGWVAALSRGVERAPAVAGPTCSSCTHATCVRLRLARGRWTDRAVGLWLAQHVDVVRGSDDAGAVLRSVLGVRRRIERAIDSRQPELFLGPCDAPDVQTELVDGVVRVATDRVCGVDLYGSLGDTEVECQACGCVYDIKDRRAFMLEAVRDVWARPAQIAEALTSLGTPLTAGRLDQWISRDKKRHRRCPVGEPCGCILQVGIDSDEVDANGRPLGKPWYRVGAVIDRLEAMRLAQASVEAVS
jgi:hypothetical protein